MNVGFGIGVEVGVESATGFGAGVSFGTTLTAGGSGFTMSMLPRKGSSLTFSSIRHFDVREMAHGALVDGKRRLSLAAYVSATSGNSAREAPAGID